MENVPNVRIAVVIWLEQFSAGSFSPQSLALLLGMAEFRHSVLSRTADTGDARAVGDQRAPLNFPQVASGKQPRSLIFFSRGAQIS